MSKSINIELQKKNKRKFLKSINLSKNLIKNKENLITIHDDSNIVEHNKLDGTFYQFISQFELNHKKTMVHDKISSKKTPIF